LFVPSTVALDAKLALTTLVIVTLLADVFVKVEVVSVKLPMLVTVLPNTTDVFPRVIEVAKLLSNCDKGIDVVALANVYGTAILEPHSEFMLELKSVDDESSTV